MGVEFFSWREIYVSLSGCDVWPRSCWKKNPYAICKIPCLSGFEKNTWTLFFWRKWTEVETCGIYTGLYELRMYIFWGLARTHIMARECTCFFSDSFSMLESLFDGLCKNPAVHSDAHDSLAAITAVLPVLTLVVWPLTMHRFRVEKQKMEFLARNHLRTLLPPIDSQTLDTVKVRTMLRLCRCYFSQQIL